MEQLTETEINERAAILKRFKSLLQKQRDKFYEYLTVLEKQQDSITKEDAGALLAHTELEEHIVENIMNLKKIIAPVNAMYNVINKNEDGVHSECISSLERELNLLQTKVLKQNDTNRNLIKVHLSEIHRQLKSLNNPYKTLRSIYAEKAPVGNYVEIQA